MNVFPYDFAFNLITMTSHITTTNGATAQSRALATLTGFVMILRCRLSAPRSPGLVVLIQPPETSSGEATIDI
jgi:hypothetical protein